MRETVLAPAREARNGHDLGTTNHIPDSRRAAPHREGQFDKAETAPSGPKREQMLASACAYLSLGDMKVWTSSRDLQPPK
jgi:hypothetical protein